MDSYRKTIGRIVEFLHFKIRIIFKKYVSPRQELMIQFICPKAGVRAKVLAGEKC